MSRPRKSLALPTPEQDLRPEGLSCDDDITPELVAQMQERARPWLEEHDWVLVEGVDLRHRILGKKPPKAV